MRPRTLGEVVGQQHLLGPGAPLRRIVEGSGAASVLLYGPPGTGKTTLASLISGATGRRFEALSALSAGVKEVRGVIELARRRLLNGEQTVLFIDEVHRFSKTQQDALLAAVENRIVLLVARHHRESVASPWCRRCCPVRWCCSCSRSTAADVQELLERAVIDERGFGGSVTIADDAMEHLVRLASGDARRALTALEAAQALRSNRWRPTGPSKSISRPWRPVSTKLPFGTTVTATSTTTSSAHSSRAFEVPTSTRHCITLRA